MPADNRHMIRTIRYPALLAAVIGAAVALALPAAATARSKCFGHRATIVGSNQRNHIKGTHHRDVIVGKGGNDELIGNGGRDIICGDSGNDRIFAGKFPHQSITKDDPTKLSGGPGNDLLEGGFNDDFMVGDNASFGGNAKGPVGKDDLEGEFGNDYEIGDNYSSGGNADGGRHDFIQAQKGADTIIGDSAVTGDGRARGGANDHFASSSGHDFEVGDSYSPQGRAIGGGNDELNAGPGDDLAVGDSYTRTGFASGSGRDQLHMQQQNDVAYGDNHAARSAGRVRGGKHDFIGGFSGIDHLHGGPRDDTCNGGSGHHDTAEHCEFVLEVP